MTFQEELIAARACQKAVYWVGDKTFAEAWETCEHADWMLWLCAKHTNEPGWMTRNDLISEACYCAERAERFIPYGEMRPQECTKTVRKYLRGEATLEDVQIAWDAAWAAAGAAEHRAMCNDIRSRWPKIGEVTE